MRSSFQSQNVGWIDRGRAATSGGAEHSEGQRHGIDLERALREDRWSPGNAEALSHRLGGR